jgi:hypothetical protein
LPKGKGLGGDEALDQATFIAPPISALGPHWPASLLLPARDGSASVLCPASVLGSQLGELKLLTLRTIPSDTSDLVLVCSSA